MSPSGPRLALAILVCASCGGAGSPGSASSAADGPSVLLVTLDTTRRDRLGCYGHEAARTPRIDALAESGVRFENAFSHVPFTLPSHASLFTGIHPAGHGVHVNYGGLAAVNAEVRTLAQVLAGRGYRTGAFVAAKVLNAGGGLERGFDHYSGIPDPPEGEAYEVSHVQRAGDLVCDEALRWLDLPSEAPFFAWVHFFDPHDPYTPPAGFEDVGVDDYDGEIAFVDVQVGRLVDWLESRGVRADTLVVLVADHGEGLSDHGEETHGLFVYDTTLRVPLIVSRPDVVVAGHVARAAVGLVDVMPTVLAHLDVAPPAEIEGRDLSAALAGTSLETRPVYFESEYAMRSMGWAPLRGRIEYPWKYTEAPRPELFRLDEDPGELQNLFESEPDRAARLRAELAAFRDRAVRRSASETGGGDDARSHLAMLGYLASETELPQDVDIASLRDPKDAHPIYWEAKRAAVLVAEGEDEEAFVLLERLVLESPESTTLWGLLGRMRLKRSDWKGAEEALEHCLAITPDVARRVSFLGDALRGQGRIDEALAKYEHAVELDPGLGQTHSRIGLIHARRRETDAAIAAYRRFVELEPDSPNAHCNLAGVLMQKGFVEESLSELRAALVCDPACVPAHEGLAQILTANGRRAEAIAARRQAVASLPTAPEPAAALAWLLATSSQQELRAPAEAVELARRARALDSENPRYADVLAAAQAATGDFAGACLSSEVAISLGRGQLPAEAVRGFEERLELYRQERGYYE